MTTTMTTTCMLLSELHPHRHGNEPHCITCLGPLVPTDRVEFVTPAWVTVGPATLILWHANEACATSVYVAKYLGIVGRCPLELVHSLQQ